jgi:hypothetical protein
LAVGQVGGEEVAASGDAVAAVVRHCRVGFFWGLERGS